MLLNIRYSTFNYHWEECQHTNHGTPGLNSPEPSCPLPEELPDSNFLQVEDSDFSSKAIAVALWILSLARSRLAEPIWPLPEDLHDSDFLQVEASDSSFNITTVTDGTFSLPRSSLAVPISSIPEDSNFRQVEASGSSPKTVTVAVGTLSLPKSSLEEPFPPFPENPQDSELQTEVSESSKTIIVSVGPGILALPTELICHILLLLTLGDLSRCVSACKTFWHVAQSSSDIQFLFGLYAQGFTDTLDWVDVSSKMYSLKRLASMWRSDFYLNPVFEETVAVDIVNYSLDMQSVKCGLWWMYALAAGRLFIRGYGTNTKLSQTWPRRSLVLQEDIFFFMLRSVAVDPLQDLAVVAFETGDEQDHDVFSVAFRSASSQCPHPDAACTSLKCKHPCDMVPGTNLVFFVGRPAICGDRIVVLYYTSNYRSLQTASNIFIQVINWRKGRVKGYPLCEQGGREANFYLLNEQRIVVIGPESRMTLYTLQELDGSPQQQIVYLLPNVLRSLRFYLPRGLLRVVPPLYVIHATPLFHGAAARPNLIPDYTTSLESQIMVLEVLSSSWQVILVIDMVIFSERAIHSEIPVPWSDWGPKYARCFPHHPSHRISVFGSKMAYALPQNHALEPGQRLEELPAEGSFYVHIWDFNRTIAHSEHSDNVHDRNSPDRLIRRPGRLTQSYFDDDDGNIITDHPYATAVCPTGFSTHYFDRFFLEQDRLTSIWVGVLSMNTGIA
ncbi:hypothetical protein F4604DRAFT_1975550 [Suillus subluteus]|nr:hypothetical protein F4604DRAFT_1975550 [Suillus subluteus]